MALGSYSKTTWAERVRQYANRFTLALVSGSTYDFTRVEGTISAAGTPLSIANLQNIEDQVEDLTTEVLDIENNQLKMLRSQSINVHMGGWRLG